MILAALERGLDYSAISKMTIGQVVDFCIEYNNRQEQAEKRKNAPSVRKATQADINLLFGG